MLPNTTHAGGLTRRELPRGAFYVDAATIARQLQTIGIEFPCHCGELVELASDQVGARVCRCGCRYTVVDAESAHDGRRAWAALTYRLEPAEAGPGVLVRVTREA